MLEVRDLKKYYKTKGGVEVHALDGVSIQFPETGMVFLLGKSGSGKSTLLNVSGGLDIPDSGEIIVKGKSSKDFSQSDFDSYRNTFVGFVFQEYNILNEFNIETNIALALELQGKKNDKNAVNEILKQVDLEGLGKRKPNTLSGGQKQRIAIARALIKNPEIIMADEPTGALDSNTGKQVLDTLKKLSETKLIIIVSHDRDFAEEYADRIIELKDGKILSDHTKNFAQAEQLSNNIRKVGDGTIQIKNIGELSEEEIKTVIKSLKGNGEVIISNNENNITNFKKVAKITDDGSQQYFKDTDLKAINIKKYDGSQTKFIKSKLPARHALKMGASNLKIKPGRLIFTMFLSIIAFSMFGILSTLMLYNAAFSHSKALQQEEYDSLVLKKRYNVQTTYINIDSNGKETQTDEYTSYRDAYISKKDVENLNNNSYGLQFAGFYDKDIDISGYFCDNSNLPYYNKNTSLIGLCDCGEEFLLKQEGFYRIAGNYPSNNEEIAISDYIYEIFKERNYKNPNNNETKIINNENDLIGQKISIYLPHSSTRVSKTFNLTISGIYKTDNSLTNDKYDVLKKEDHSAVSDREYENLTTNIEDVYKSSYAGLGYISTDFFETYRSYLMPENNFKTYINNIPLFGLRYLNSSEYMNFKNMSDSEKAGFYPSEGEIISALTSTDVEPYSSYFKFFNVNGDVLSSIPSIRDNEVYLNVNSNTIRNMAQNLISSTTGSMSVRYDRDGVASFYPSFNESTNWENVYINYSDKTLSFIEKAGYTSVGNGDVIIGDDGKILLYARDAYEKEDHSDAKFEYDETNGYKIYTKCWFDGADDHYIGQSIQEINLTSFYYDAGNRKAYSSDQVEEISDGGYKTKYVPKDNHNVTLTKINNYYIDEEGYPSNQYKLDQPCRKGLFVNKNTGELSFKKQSNSVYTDYYYKDTNNKIYIGKAITGAYSYLDKENIKHYSYSNTFCDLGYVDMAWEYTKPMYFIDELPNSLDVVKSLVKIYVLANDSWAIEVLKTFYGESIDIDKAASEPISNADIKAVLNALEALKTSYEDSGNQFLSLTDPVAIINKNQSVTELNVKGIFVTDYSIECYQEIFLSNEWRNISQNPNENYGSGRNIERTNYVVDVNAQYGGVITHCESNTEQIKFMMKNYDDDSYYTLENRVSMEIGYITEFLKELKTAFLIIGLVMALFSGLMLLNFISTSISNKEKEIGILRAVGARGSDVFKIFFSESAIICLICVAFSVVISGIGCYIFNNEISDKIRMQFFEFGPLNIAIIIGIALIVGVLGTLLPVIKASRRPPVESIRAL